MFKSNPRKQPHKCFVQGQAQNCVYLLRQCHHFQKTKSIIYPASPIYLLVIKYSDFLEGPLLLFWSAPLQEILKMPRTSTPTSITVLLGIVSSLLCPTQHDLTGCQCRKHSNSAYAEKNKLVYVLYSTCAQCAR